MTDFPRDDVLLARGKYATVGSDKRARMKELHTRMTRITDQCRVLLRYDDNAASSIELYQAMVLEVQDTGKCLQALTALQTELDELKPLAWGKEKSDVE